MLQCKVPAFRVRFEWNLNYLDRYSRNHQISYLAKISLVGAEFHADRQTDERADKTKQIAAFRNFEKRLKRLNKLKYQNKL